MVTCIFGDVLAIYDGILTLSIYELAILAGVKFPIYAAKGAAPDYHVRSLRFDQVEGGIFPVVDPFGQLAE